MLSKIHRVSSVTKYFKLIDNTNKNIGSYESDIKIYGKQRLSNISDNLFVLLWNTGRISDKPVDNEEKINY